MIKRHVPPAKLLTGGISMLNYDFSDDSVESEKTSDEAERNEKQ